MALPLLLAGPIVRRVEPSLVSVWVALSESATVALKVWEGRISAQDAGTPLVTSEAGVSTLRMGDKLHIALAVIKIPPTSPQLQPKRIYSYDLEIKVGSTTHTLNSLGLLTSGTFEGRKMLALGYEELILPSFALPPEEIEDLRVLFGSCRRPVNTHHDAMALIDDLMDSNPEYSVKDPLKRPHQLFLGGDQIYADDVSDVHSHMLIELGKELIGKEANGTAREHLMVDSFRRAKKPVEQVASLDDYGEPITRATTPDPDPNDFQLPADHAAFPAGRRNFETLIEAQMTTTSGSSHLFGFGEFAAMYLTVWSNAVWPRSGASPFAIAFPTDDQLTIPQWADRLPTWIAAPLNAIESRDSQLTTDAEKALSPFHSDFNRSPRNEADLPAHMAALSKRYAVHREILTTFEEGLAKIRRVLANVPTYMIFDDHDVTDDWNLNPAWCDRVYSTSLGVTMARNALLSYALFQDWGNDPLKYEKDDYKKLLEQAVKLFPANSKGPDLTVASEIDKLFGLGLRGTVSPSGRVSAVNPPIKWHFKVPGPKHLAVAIDNRTRRSYLTRNGPPGNVEGSLDETATTAQTEQIPAGPFTDGKEVLLVIAPLQVVGPPLLDELVAPAAYRAFDALSYSKNLDPNLKFGTRLMAGTDPDAIEAWAFDAETLEALFKRLQPYRQVVFLSGDVHYSTSTVLSYFTKDGEAPARFAQFTSSGFKNVMPEYITVVDRSFSTAHKMIRAGIGAERIGWLTKPTNPIVLPEGKSERDIPRELRARLQREPTMLPTYGWPKGSTINASTKPDWSWRVDPVFDVRENRPEGILPLPIDDAAVEARLKASGAPEIDKAYSEVASKHQHALATLRNSRQILFRSNFGAVRFKKRDDVLFAVHEMYTTAPGPREAGSPEPKPECFVLHEVALSTPNAKRPEERLQPLTAEQS